MARFGVDPRSRIKSFLQSKILFQWPELSSFLLSQHPDCHRIIMDFLMEETVEYAISLGIDKETLKSIISSFTEEEFIPAGSRRRY